MNKEALGRALGYGARHAAKTLQRAAEAAATPSSEAPASRMTNTTAARPATPSRSTPAHAVRAAKTVGRSAWKPIATFSSVLWLQVTGTFFLLFAVTLGSQVWRLRHAAAGTPERTHMFFYAALTLAFAYFCISNFVRARRRERS